MLCSDGNASPFWPRRSLVSGHRLQEENSKDRELEPDRRAVMTAGAELDDRSRPGGEIKPKLTDGPRDRQESTQSRRWMFGRIFGLDGRESYRELRLELLCCLAV